MAYKLFHRREGRIKRGAYITLTKDARIGVTIECYERYFKDYNSVLFYYNEDKKLVGIKPTKDTSDDSYDIRIGRKGTSISITGYAFLKYFNIDYSVTRRYVPTWNEEEGLLEIDLNNPL